MKRRRSQLSDLHLLWRIRVSAVALLVPPTCLGFPAKGSSGRWRPRVVLSLKMPAQLGDGDTATAHGR